MAGYGMADDYGGAPEQVRISGHQGYYAAHPQNAAAPAAYGGGGAYQQDNGNPYGYYSEEHDGGPPSSPKEVGRQRHAQAFSQAQEEYQQLQDWQQAELAQQQGQPLNDYRSFEHGHQSSVDTRTAWQHPVRQQPEGLVSGDIAASLVAAHAAAAAAPPAAGSADMPYFSTRARPAKRHVLRQRGPAPLPVPAQIAPKPTTRSAGVQACVLQDEGRRQTDSAHDELDASPRDRELAAAAAVAHVAAARMSPLQHEQLQQQQQRQQQATDMQMGWYKYGAADYAALPASIPPARSADPRRVRMSC